MSPYQQNREILFSVTASDCDWDYMRGTGPGGQKRNKTESKVRCTHRPSGAVGVSDETRSQHENRRTAFVKMARTEEFRKWHKSETARRLGTMTLIEDAVRATMTPDHLKVEAVIDGKWEIIE